MDYIYYCLIIAKRRTYESVPNNLKADVLQMLTDNNYDQNGDFIPQ